MIRLFYVVMLLVLSTAACGAAVKPLGLLPIGGGTTAAGEPWEAYRVRCNNGKDALISSIRGTSQWCVNDPSPLPRNCRKDKVHAAKLACNPQTWKHSNFPASED